MLYRMSCKCILSQDEIIRPRRSNLNRYSCPHHKGSKVLYRLAICIECNTEFEVPARGGLPLRCKPCRAEYNRLKRQGISLEWYHKNGKPKQKESRLRNEALRDDSRWNCIGHDECIVKYDRCDCTPCLNCEDYKRMEMAI